MAEKSLISWTHGTWNPWVGCEKIAPECAHCYINREIRKQSDGQGGRRKPWGELYLTKTWADPHKWQAELRRMDSDPTPRYPNMSCKRIFTCSLSDFFHQKVDKRSVCPAGYESAPSMALSQHKGLASRAGSTLWRD